MSKKTRMADKPCSAEECGNLVGPHGSRGLCQRHYRQYKREGRLPLKDGETRQKCKVDGCERWAEITGLCQAHYYRQKRTGKFGTAEVRSVIERPPFCTIPGCGRRHYCQGYCRMHYERWYRGTEDIEHVVYGLISEYREEYNVWLGMKQRCYYQGHTGYENYGGRGIKVCDRWTEKTLWIQKLSR